MTFQHFCFAIVIFSFDLCGALYLLRCRVVQNMTWLNEVPTLRIPKVIKWPDTSSYYAARRLDLQYVAFGKGKN